ncbi:type I polyketide synthase [Saccharomonospora xinjiangensis]|uniref:type I polyketide synthase n=1 Tax=Saccharomonospora xinjiangensis TaxID=75294 RepID=UPI000A055EC7|nr:SDR family NAD(P)-dependent oxidoreductase [Saccharomonospora xinjiangensis]
MWFSLCCFVVLVSLARLWESWGVVPVGVVGHSQGEIAAACVALLSSITDDALGAQVCCRLSFLERDRQGWDGVGGSCLVHHPFHLPLGVGVAAVNGPSSVVVSGDVGGLEGFVAGCERDGVRVRWVAVDYASHSDQVGLVRDELLSVLSSVVPRSSSVPFFSTVTGGWLDTAELGAEYWYRNLRETVRFSDAIETLTAQGHRSFVECSPHPVLTMAIQETSEDAVALGTLRRDDGDLDRFLRSLGEAHTRGVEVDWSAVIGDPGGPAISLPTYAFQHERYWPQPTTRPGDPAGLGQIAAGHPLLGATVHPADGGGRILTGSLSAATHPWLADHSVLDTVIVPGSAFVELALRAGRELGHDRIDELTLEAPLVLEGDTAYDLQVSVTGESGTSEVSIHSRPSGAVEENWTRHASATLTHGTEPAASPEGQWPPQGAVPLAAEDLYQRLADSGIDYGPAFQGLRAAWQLGDAEILADVQLPESEAADAGRYGLHPALLDAALHGMGLGSVFTTPEDTSSGGSVAFSWSGVSLHASGATSVRVRLAPAGDNAVSVRIADAAGAAVASVESLVMRPVSADQLGGGGRLPRNSLFRLTWPEQPLPADAFHRIALVGPDTWNWAPWLSTGEHSGVFPTPGALADAVAAGTAQRPDIIVTTVTTVPGDPASSGDDVPAEVRDALADVLGTVRAWLSDDRLADTRLAVVTRRAIPAGPEAEPELPAASVWGLLRSAQSEHPDRIVVVDIEDEKSDIGLLPAAVAGAEPQLAIRAGRLLAPRLTRAEPAEATGFGFTEHDTVLITGASGGLGRLVARHLATAHGVRHLVLLSRRGDQAEGAGELAADLVEAGAEVTFAACDVADPAAVAAVLDAIPADRPLAGVVHTAGVVDDGLVESLGTGQVDRVLRPKADGAWNLHRLTGELDLKAFILFSSGATTFGGPGQGAYAAANAFLDALAVLRRARGLSATSLAWGVWSESNGMGSRLDETALARMARNGALPLSVAEGLALLDATHGLDHAALVPVRLDLAALRELGDTLPPMVRELVPTPARKTAAGDSATLLRTLAALGEADRRRELLDTVRANAAAVLGHASASAVDPERSFLEQGFDSLTAVELRNRVTRITGARLRATLIFDFPTPSRLTEHLLEQLDLDSASVPAPSMSGTDTEDTVLDQLDRLSRALPSAVSDDDSRRRVAARLRDLLRSCGEPSGSGGDLDTASDDELFALVDNEFERGVEIA